MTEEDQKEHDLAFENWKKEAIEYLHSLASKNNDFVTEGIDVWDWMLGSDDEDMLPSFNDGESPRAYVDYQIECAQ